MSYRYSQLSTREKKKLVRNIIVFAIILLAILAGFAWLGNSLFGPGPTYRADGPLQQAVISHYRTHGVSTVTLGELTPFEWEKAFQFRASTSPGDVYDAIGVHFTPEELTAGILFAKDGEIVSWELFPERREGFIDVFPHRFMMSPPGSRIHLPNDGFEISRDEERGLYLIRALE